MRSPAADRCHGPRLCAPAARAALLRLARRRAAGSGGASGFVDVALIVNLTMSPLPALGSPRCDLAVDDLHRACEPACCASRFADEVRQRGERCRACPSIVNSSPCPATSVSHSRSGSARLTSSSDVHGPRLPAAQLLDQRDALLQLALRVSNCCDLARAPTRSCCVSASARAMSASSLSETWCSDQNHQPMSDAAWRSGRAGARW